MTKYETLCDLKAKIDAEGGLGPFIRYGISANDLHPKLKQLFELFEEARIALEDLEQVLGLGDCDEYAYDD
jgi:hypothetical protein